MNFFKSLNPIKDVGEALDGLFTSDEEKITAETLRERVNQSPSMLQALANIEAAKHRSVFVAGGRPAHLWVSALAWFFVLIINPAIQWVTDKPGPDIPVEALVSLSLGILGIYGTQRTFEKYKGVTK